MALITNKKFKSKCDVIWAELVKKRAGFKCEYCFKESGLNAHHIYSRSNGSTRHDPENGVALCVAHHVFSSSFSAHKTPADFMDWITEKRGQPWLTALRQRAKMPLTGVDYRLLAILLQQDLDRTK